MKQSLLSLTLATATHTIAAEPADYCSDLSSWQEWQQLLADNPTDDSSHLYMPFGWVYAQWYAPVRLIHSVLPGCLNRCRMLVG